MNNYYYTGWNWEGTGNDVSGPFQRKQPGERKVGLDGSQSCFDDRILDSCHHPM